MLQIPESGTPQNPTGGGPLDLVADLLQALDHDGVDYCHWKSNEGLDQALRGEGDLDLLVNPSHRLAFGMCLQRLGFKKAVDRRDRHFPGIVHYFGRDPSTGTIVDLHVHRRLVVGSDLLKNFELPLHPYLDSSEVSDRLVRVPAAEYEYVLFVTRMVLKRRPLPWFLGFPDPRLPFKTLFAWGRPGLAGSEAREFEYLRNRIDRSRLGKALSSVLPVVDERLFADCEASLSGTARWEWFPVGHRLARALKPYRRRSPLSTLARAGASRVGFLARSQQRRFSFLARSRRPRLSCRGPVIAFVGGDGAGKTTNVEELERTLGEVFETRTFHLGKPPYDLLRSLIRIVSKGLRLLMGNKLEEEVPPLLALRYIGVARGRLRLVRRSRRFAEQGGAAICDRFPIDGLALSEGPLVASLVGDQTRLRKWLVRLEERYYERIRSLPQPDRIFALTLDPEISIARRPEDDPEFIRPRLQEIQDRSWADVPNVRVVDASQPLETVVESVRSEAWTLLPSWAPQVELAGPAGAGKSTLAEHLTAAEVGRLEGITTLRNHKTRLVWRSLQLSPAALRVGLSSYLWLVRKRVLLDLWESRTPPSESPTLYDQGPYFTLAHARWMLGDRIARSPVHSWYGRYRRRATELIDVVVLLDSPEHVLQERLSGRDQDHLVKSSSPEVQASFLDASKRHLGDALLGASGAAECSIVELSTDGVRPDELADRVIRLLVT